MSDRRVFWPLVLVFLLLTGAGALAQELSIMVDEGAPIFSTSRTPTITGKTTAPAGSVVTVTIGANSYRTTVLEKGEWILNWPVELESGSYEISASVETADGQTARTTGDLRVDIELRMPRQPIFPDPVGDYAPPPLKPNTEDFVEFTDRWRITPWALRELVPTYIHDSDERPKGKWDPYNQNWLKGDRPIPGKEDQLIFFSLTGVSDSLLEYRNTPVPSGVSAEEPTSIEFFGEGDQALYNQNITITGDLYKGLTVYRPIDWRVRATITGNFNAVDIRETAGVNPDVRRGSDREDGQLGLQELFWEQKIRDLSVNYDFLSYRVGVQQFTSDFRGFIFSDQNLGARLFGNWDNNKWQYNLAAFYRLEKDTNSGLNIATEFRHQTVLVANIYKQDFIHPGYTTSFSLHHMDDKGELFYDTNDILVRPDPIGDFKEHEIKATYIGWAGLGKINRWNVDHALYYVFGEDDHSAIAGLDPIGGPVGPGGVSPGRTPVDISAYMAAFELSIDKDWWRPRAAFFLASGDDDVFDRDAEGFDGIFPNPNFVGGGFSFWNRLGIRLAGTGVGLVQRGSLLPDLTSSKDEGQPNFVNPGIVIGSLGLDVDLTPRSKLIFTGNYLRFMKTEVLEGVLFQGDISKEIGLDISAGVRYRPFLSNNVIIVGGAALFVPGSGFEDIYEDDDLLYQTFTNLILTF